MLAFVVAFVVGASSVDVAAAVVLTATAVDSAGDAVGTLDVEGMLEGS